MKFRELMKSSFSTLRMNGRRTFLTMFGIIIGIAAVITILSLGNGFQAEMMDKLSKDDQGRMNQEFMFVPNDSEGLKNHEEPFSKEILRGILDIPGVDDVEVETPKWDESFYPTVTYLGREFKPEISYYEETQNRLLVGRNLTLEDSTSGRRSIVLTEELAQEIFGDVKTALEQVLTVDGENYIVVGVYEQLPPMDQMRENEEAMSDPYFMPETSLAQIPVGTYKRYYPESHDNQELRVFYHPDIQNIKNLNHEVQEYLETKGLDKDVGNYHFYDMSEMMEEIGKSLSMVTTFISAVAAISLFIAGVGVMNMMYISVAERTKEIGIRRSIGATKQSIQWQFLFEGIAITTFGGVIGYGIGAGMAYLVAIFLPFPAKLDVATAMGAVLVSMLIGIVFSVFPARAASKKNVVEILR